MTPKEKAKELVDKFRPHAKYWDCYNGVPLDENHAKQSALIAVGEILKQFVGVYNSLKNASVIDSNVEDSANYKFWQEVKQEIEKL